MSVEGQVRKVRKGKSVNSKDDGLAVSGLNEDQINQLNIKTSTFKRFSACSKVL